MNKRIFLISFFMTAAAVITSCGEVGYLSSDESAADIAALEEIETESETEIETESETETEAETQMPTEPLEMPDGYELSGSCRLDVETILQNPELPTGCEVTALATALNYFGFDIDKVELCDNFLPIEYDSEYTFNDAYIGNPKSSNGFGCYAPVIVRTAEDYFESIDAEWGALDLSDTDFQDLFYQLEKGRPVIVWASMGLKDVTMRLYWTTDDGDEAWFASLEHCMVLTGYDYDEEIVYAADPLKGDMEYSIERFESVYEQLGRQAVIVYEKEN